MVLGVLGVIVFSPINFSCELTLFRVFSSCAQSLVSLPIFVVHSGCVLASGGRICGSTANRAGLSEYLVESEGKGQTGKPRAASPDSWRLKNGKPRPRLLLFRSTVRVEHSRREETDDKHSSCRLTRLPFGVIARSYATV